MYKGLNNNIFAYLLKMSYTGTLRQENNISEMCIIPNTPNIIHFTYVLGQLVHTRVLVANNFPSEMDEAHSFFLRVYHLFTSKIELNFHIYDFNRIFRLREFFFVHGEFIVRKAWKIERKRIKSHLSFNCFIIYFFSSHILIIFRLEEKK